MDGWTGKKEWVEGADRQFMQNAKTEGGGGTRRCAASVAPAFFLIESTGTLPFMYGCSEPWLVWRADKSGPREGPGLHRMKSSSTQGSRAAWQHGNQPLRLPPSNRSSLSNGSHQLLCSPSAPPSPRNETFSVRFWLKRPSQRRPPIQPFSSSYAAKKQARKHESPLAEWRFQQALSLGV
jgi:hypothetical protein